jgi:hypothetical protein
MPIGEPPPCDAAAPATKRLIEVPTSVSIPPSSAE